MPPSLDCPGTSALELGGRYGATLLVGATAVLLGAAAVLLGAAAVLLGAAAGQISGRLLAGPARVHHAQAGRQAHQLGRGPQAELPVDPVKVSIDGLARDAELGGDLARHQALG